MRGERVRGGTNASSAGHASANVRGGLEAAGKSTEVAHEGVGSNAALLGQLNATLVGQLPQMQVHASAARRRKHGRGNGARLRPCGPLEPVAATSRRSIFADLCSNGEVQLRGTATP